MSASKQPDLQQQQQQLPHGATVEAVGAHGPPPTVTTAPPAAPLQNVLVYVGNDNYAHAYAVNTQPPEHQQVQQQFQQQQQQQQHMAGGGGGAIYNGATNSLQPKPNAQAFYPNFQPVSTNGYHHHPQAHQHQQLINGYKPMTLTTGYLVSNADNTNDNNNSSYVTVVSNNTLGNSARCDSVKSEAAESSCSSLSSVESACDHAMSYDSVVSNGNVSVNNGHVSVNNGHVSVGARSDVVPVLTTVAPSNVPAAPTIAVCGGVGSAVTVPYGWKRLVSNGAVIYVSPSNIVLTSLEHVKDYLQTSGTCKCGLECPFHYVNTFNFDLKVVGKPTLLTPDINVDLTKLCNHKRKLLSLTTLSGKMTEPINHIQKDDGVAKKKAKANKKHKVSTTLPTSLPPYNSTSASSNSISNNASPLLHRVEKNLCNVGSQYAQQQPQQQIWPNQIINTPSTHHKLPPTSHQPFTNAPDGHLQPLYRYQPSAHAQPQVHQLVPAPQQMQTQQQVPAPPPVGPDLQQHHRYPAVTNNSSGFITSGDLASLQIQGVATSAAVSNGGSPQQQQVQIPVQMLQHPGNIAANRPTAMLPNHLFAIHPTVDQSGPGRPPNPQQQQQQQQHQQQHPNPAIRLPTACYDPSSKQQQTIRLPVPYPNAPGGGQAHHHNHLHHQQQQHVNGLRMPPLKGPTWNGLRQPGVHQQPEHSIYERVPPLPQVHHQMQQQQGGGLGGQVVWSEEVTRKKPKSGTKAQKKPRPTYHLNPDPLQHAAPQHSQRPCPNVDVRQMGASDAVSGRGPNILNIHQQSSFNAVSNSAGHLDGSGMGATTVTTASPSFIDDPSGYLAQQTALLNSTISGQGLQMNGCPPTFACNTPPPLHQNAPPTTASSIPKQPPPYHRTSSKQQQQHYSGGQVFVAQAQAQQQGISQAVLQAQAQQQGLSQAVLQAQAQQQGLSQAVLQAQAQQQSLQIHQQQQQQHMLVNDGSGGVTLVSGDNGQQNHQQNAGHAQCQDCLIGQQNVMASDGSARSYSRPGSGSDMPGTPSSVGTNEDPVTSSTYFFDPNQSPPSTAATTTHPPRHLPQPPQPPPPPPPPAVSSPDSRPIQGGTVSTSNVSPQHDNSSNSSTGSSGGGGTSVGSPPQQQQQQLGGGGMHKVAAMSQQQVVSSSGGGGGMQHQQQRVCVTTVAAGAGAGGVRTVVTSAAGTHQGLPIITPVTLSRAHHQTNNPHHHYQLTTQPTAQHHHHQQQLITLAVTSGSNVCNGTTAVVVSSGANGTLVAKSPLEMVQSVVIKSSPSHHHAHHHHHHHPTTLPPGHILVSSGGQLLMASTSAPGATNTMASSNAQAQQHHHHHLMAPPPPKQHQQQQQQQVAMPPMSVSPMVTNVTASVTQVIPAVAQQVLGQQTVLVNTLPTPSFLLQPGVTMTMDGLANLHQIPHLLTTNNLLHHHQANNNSLLSPPHQDLLHAIAAKTNHNGGSNAAISPKGGAKGGKKRKSGGGSQNVTGMVTAQPVTSMLHIAAGPGGVPGGVVSPQSFASAQLQMHSPQTPVMQALTIVPGKGGGPPQLVMNTSPQATTQHINLLQPVNLLNSATGMHVQNFPTIQQFILPNLGGMVVNADGTATILPAATASPQSAADSGQHAQPLQMQLQLQHVNGQNVLTPVQHPGGHITFSTSPTNSQNTLGMVIRTNPGKPHQASPLHQHSPATAQFLSPTNNTGATATSHHGQFVVNGATFSGQLSPLVTTAGISPRGGGGTVGDYQQNGGGQQQQTVMVPCTPVSSNGANTYVHQNTTIVQQQTTMVTNPNQPNQSTSNNLRSPAPQQPQQQTTTLNVNLNEQNQFIISDKSLILQTQAQAQAQLQQQMQLQQRQQQQQQCGLNQVINLNLIGNQGYRQSVSTQTATGFQQVPATVVATSNTFCQTSSSIAAASNNRHQAHPTPTSFTLGPGPGPGPGHGHGTTPPTPVSPPDTTTLSPLAPQQGLQQTGSGSNGRLAADGSDGSSSGGGGGGTAIVVSEWIPPPSSTTITTTLTTTNTTTMGGQSPMPAGADTTTYSTGSSGHSTDDGLSPAPSNCSSVGSYAVSSGGGGGGGGGHILGDGRSGRDGQRQEVQQQGQQNCAMAMVHCVSSSEPDATEFTLIDQLDWAKNGITIQQQQPNQRHSKKHQNNFNIATTHNDSTIFRYEMDNKSNEARRTYSTKPTHIDLLHYGAQPQNQRQTTTLNYPESASTVQYVSSNATNGQTEAIIVQQSHNQYNNNNRSAQRTTNASTVVLDHVGGSYANNIVEELLKQQQLDQQKVQQQQQQERGRSHQRKKQRGQQHVAGVRHQSSGLFGDEDTPNACVSTTLTDHLQSTIDSVASDSNTTTTTAAPHMSDALAFSVGDLVWAPAHGCPAWPGQVVSTDACASDTVLVKWFGDGPAATTTTSAVLKTALCTLMQGLEVHHLAHKRARTSRKLNTQLEKAIQQAMSELDKLSDITTVFKSDEITSIVECNKEKKSPEKSKKCNVKVGSTSSSKVLTVVKKTSSRLRSQK